MDLQVAKLVSVESLQLKLVSSTELELAGTLATATAQRELSGILSKLHARIVEQKIQSFTVDVRPLNFVNSSAIRVFVDWIARAESAGYRLTFITERGVTWHRLSFSVLRSLAPQNVEIIEKNAALPGQPS
ncbi:MAG TPA: hypothetical protein VGM44_18750 [Polyangiaceae bacterium]|jgi:hypothetical protein